MALIVSFTTFLICALAIFAVAYLFAWKTKKQALAHMRLPLLEVEIYRDLLKFEKEYSILKQNGVFNDFSKLAKIADNVISFLDASRGAIDINTIFVSKIETTNEERALLKSEFEHCPEEIKKILRFKNEILMRVVLLKHKRTAYIMGKIITYDVRYILFILIILMFTLFIKNLIYTCLEYFGGPAEETRTKQKETESSQNIIKDYRDFAVLF